MKITDTEANIIWDMLDTLESAANHQWITNRPVPSIGLTDPDGDSVGGLDPKEVLAACAAVRSLLEGNVCWGVEPKQTPNIA